MIEKLKKLKKSKILKWLLICLAIVLLAFVLYRSYIYFYGNSSSNINETDDNYSGNNNTETSERNDGDTNIEDEETEDSAEDYYNRANELSRQQKYQEAIIEINEAIILNEINDIYWSKKASFYALLGDEKNEKATLEQGLLKIPDSEVLKAKLDLLNQEIGTNMEGVRE